MSVMSDVGQTTLVHNRDVAGAEPPSFSIAETYWGYIIQARSAPPVAVILLQVLAWALGLSLAVAAAGVWVLPQTADAVELLPLRAGASLIFGAFAALLLWFASRGTEAELQVDTAQGELREIVRNRAGRPTLLGRYGFDAIGGVFIDRKAGGRALLVLRYQNTAQILQVADGPEGALIGLRDRLGRDLMLKSRLGTLRQAV